MVLPILLALALQSAPDVAAAPAPKPADAAETPHGAPADDYGFTAWCRGALSGHMELYPAVKAEMQKVEEEKAAKEDSRYTTDAQREAAVKRRVKEALDDTKLDEEQLEAGRTYLKLYSDAIAAAEAASAKNLHQQGEEAQDAGYRIWAAARGAEPRTKMWSWVMWELPARCETAARRMLDRSSVLAGALKPQPLAERMVQAKADLPAEPAAPKPDEAKAEDSKPDEVKPADGVETEKPAITESKLADVTPADAKPADAEKPVDAAKAPDPASAEEAQGAKVSPTAPISLEGPLLRRRLDAPPVDAPDAPRPDPKP